MSLDALADHGALGHVAATFNPVGGSTVSQGELKALQASMRELAADLGFPQPLGQGTSEFDHRFMSLLYEKMGIVPGDAGHEGVWSFMSLVLVPELPVWRFPARTEERLVGTPRNALRRLWWRAHQFGAGPESAAVLLGEDQLVQVEERPTLGGDPVVAQAVCRAFLEVRDSNPGVPQELLMREGTKRLIRVVPTTDIYGLTRRQLNNLCIEALQSAAVAIALSSAK